MTPPAHDAIDCLPQCCWSNLMPAADPWQRDIGTDGYASEPQTFDADTAQPFPCIAFRQPTRTGIRGVAPAGRACADPIVKAAVADTDAIVTAFAVASRINIIIITSCVY
jgi:hypothetical protein